MQEFLEKMVQAARRKESMKARSRDLLDEIMGKAADSAPPPPPPPTSPPPILRSRSKIDKNVSKTTRQIGATSQKQHQQHQRELPSKSGTLQKRLSGSRKTLEEMEESIKRLLQDASTHQSELTGTLLQHDGTTNANTRQQAYGAELKRDVWATSASLLNEGHASAFTQEASRFPWLNELDRGSEGSSENDRRGARIADLRDQDKVKLAKLIQQLVEVTKDREKLSERLDKTEADLTAKLQRLNDDHSSLQTRYEEMKKKFAQSLTMIKTYQDKLTEMESELRHREDLDLQRNDNDDEMRQLRDEVVRLRSLVMEQAQAQAQAQALAQAQKHTKEERQAPEGVQPQILASAVNGEGINHRVVVQAQKEMQHAQTQASILEPTDLEWERDSPKSRETNPKQGGRHEEFLNVNELEHEQLLEALTRESKRAELGAPHGAAFQGQPQNQYQRKEHVHQQPMSSTFKGHVHSDDEILESFLQEQRKRYDGQYSQFAHQAHVAANGDLGEQRHTPRGVSRRPATAESHRASSEPHSLHVHTMSIDRPPSWAAGSSSSLHSTMDQVDHDESSIFGGGEDGLINHDAFESSQFETSLFDIVDELEGRPPRL